MKHCIVASVFLAGLLMTTPASAIPGQLLVNELIAGDSPFARGYVFAVIDMVEVGEFGQIGIVHPGTPEAKSLYEILAQMIVRTYTVNPRKYALEEAWVLVVDAMKELFPKKSDHK